MEQRLFVERFLVPAPEEPSRPGTLRYDEAQELTVDVDGRPFVATASIRVSATETKAIPSDRDEAVARSGEITRVQRDKPARLGEETAVTRDHPRPLAELWTRTGTRRDTSEHTRTILRPTEARVGGAHLHSTYARQSA